MEKDRRRSMEKLAATYRERSDRFDMLKEKQKAGIQPAPKELKDLKRELEMDEHKIEPGELAARLQTDLTHGLSPDGVHFKQQTFGPNELTPPPQEPEWRKFMRQLTQFFSLLLIAGSVLSFIGYGLSSTDPSNLYIAVVLLIVVLLTATFSYLQDRSSSKVMEKFRNFLPQQATVIRGGVKAKIAARDIVPGDLVEIIGGDKIPADVRIVSTTGLKVDNSSLTGEPEPQARAIKMSHENPLETKNLAFFGTLATEGQALALVFQTGDRTVISQIAGLASQTSEEETTLHREIHHFVKIITAFALTSGFVFLAVGLGITKGAVISNLIFMIGIIVANVPEGLLPTVTVSLALTAKRMASKNVLVKTLECVETLGSTTTICSDKTGTLTQNVMTIAHLWYDSRIFKCQTSTQVAEFDPASPTYLALRRVAILCNRAVFRKDGEQTDAEFEAQPIDQRKTIGDASETGIIKFCQKQIDIMQFREQHPKLFEIPFNSINKFQVSVHSLPGDPRHLVVMKGAPERVFGRCTRYVQNGEELPITDEFRRSFQTNYEALGAMGERVLGFAYQHIAAPTEPGFAYQNDEVSGSNFPMEGHTFVGFMALIDPPRPSVPQAVKDCKVAGIKVIMVTGDHPITAEAIARQVGIITGETAEDIAKREGVPVASVAPGRAQAIVIHGEQIKEFQLEDWNRVLAYPQIVFARTSPQQKLLIVENCQRRNEIVAVTGDGVNDSPALKKANIGVAMGIAGSDVSKEAADLILLDDNFSSIVLGVEEGRLIFHNLKKSISYTLVHILPEIIPYVVYIILGLPIALTTLLILVIDLGTDMFPSICLAYEPAESDIMLRPPRNAMTDKMVTDRLISRSYLQLGVIETLGAFFAFFVVMAEFNLPPWMLVGTVATFPDENVVLGGLGFKERLAALEQAQTAYFVAIVICQLASLLSSKTTKMSLAEHGLRKNMRLLYGIIAGLVLVVLVVYVPALNMVFSTQPLPLVHWLPSIPFSFLIFFYEELRKLVMRLSPMGFIERHTYY
eukprot:TRINITY_DN940_c0_g1_i4.p1 TRINITY_DN940_c0_g1~~TRINITY_DN940_c0_g1_i4.p1  ORF type:complete len:1037 (+),score=262.23 TRINITY_DN940_c0_g1_i4:38-3112(+)